MIILISTDLLSSFCPTSLKWLNIDSDVCSPLTIWAFSIEIAFPTICSCVPIIVIPLLKVVKGTVSIGSPKSKDSIRDIPVPLNVRPCAIKLRDTTDQFIWESPKTGLPCNPTHFRDVFRKSLEEAGDVRLLTPHSCRHTYVSQMQALGVDIQTIQSIVGHADTEMTEHYLHVQESIRQSAIQLFSEAFSA